MLSYEEVLLKVKEDATLLLGNGFSIGYNDAFRYHSLWEKARELKLLTPELERTAAELATTNFEDLLLFLARVVRTSMAYGARETDDPLKKMQNDVEKVRKALIASISAIHLKPVTSFSQAKVQTAAKFLDPYANVFTTNYDLLLYWALMKSLKHTPEKRWRGDGFWIDGGQHKQLWDNTYIPKTGRTVYFLHGALHIFHQGNEIWKYRAGQQRVPGRIIHKTLRDLVAERIEAGEIPLIIAEGDWTAKRAKIAENPYLAWCFDRFGAVKGDLVIYGSSLSDQDTHIRRAIATNSAIKRLFISSRGDSPELRANVKRLVRAREVWQFFDKNAGPIEVDYFDAESARPWTEPAPPIQIGMAKPATQPPKAFDLFTIE